MDAKIRSEIARAFKDSKLVMKNLHSKSLHSHDLRDFNAPCDVHVEPSVTEQGTLVQLAYYRSRALHPRGALPAQGSNAFLHFAAHGGGRGERCLVHGDWL